MSIFRAKEVLGRGALSKNHRLKAEEKKKTSSVLRPPYPHASFIKFAFKLPYRQTEGLARKFFENSGLKTPNFRTFHYRFKTMDINLKGFPSSEELPADFVIILDSVVSKIFEVVSFYCLSGICIFFKTGS